MTIEAVEGTKYRTYEHERADWLICCDEKGCTVSIDAKNRTFGQAIVFIKARDWRIKHVHGSFLHYCPDHNDIRRA